MSIVRGPLPRRDFTVLPNATIEDERLSFRATGLLVFLLSKPPGWRISGRDLGTAKREGRDAMFAALNELEDCGYLIRRKTQCANGQFITDSYVYDTPTAADEHSVLLSEHNSPDPGNPDPENQDSVFQDSLVRTESKNLSFADSDISTVDNATHCDACDDTGFIIDDDDNVARFCDACDHSGAARTSNVMHDTQIGVGEPQNESERSQNDSVP